MAWSAVLMGSGSWVGRSRTLSVPFSLIDRVRHSLTGVSMCRTSPKSPTLLFHLKLLGWSVVTAILTLVLESYKVRLPCKGWSTSGGLLI